LSEIQKFVTAAEALETQATAENTATWIYSVRFKVAHALRRFGAICPNSQPAQELLATVMLFCGPLRKGCV
jgi:hypothetical protein